MVDDAGHAMLSNDEAVDAKDRLRATLRAARQKRSEQRRSEAAVALAEVVWGIDKVANARCVALYASGPTEPGTGPLLERLNAHGVRVLLPVLGTGLRRGWAEYVGLADLQTRAPGRPPEPSGPDLGPGALADADVVIVPALAVDTAGARLGQGGGWYDRALAAALPNALVLALLYDGELVSAETSALPRELHDLPVDAVASPSGWRRLSPGGRATG
jgi:5-formyltetrahydrofolate cyclo-ligase